MEEFGFLENGAGIVLNEENKELKIHSAYLPEIPMELDLFQFSFLQQLEIIGCHLQYIPNTIGCLQQLKYFQV
jgi:hypothetical protein